MDTGQLTLLIGFLTVIVTHVFALIHSARNRRYDIEDRKLLAAELLTRQEALAADAQDLKGLVVDNTALTVRAGEKADDAYREANNVNAKIAVLGEAVAENQVAILEGTKSAADAYHEANSVNLKIQQLHEEITNLFTQQARSRVGNEERRGMKG